MQRVIVLVAAYAKYMTICRHRDLDQMALHYFFQQHALDAQLLPSQKRYVKYFACLLANQLQLAATQRVFLQRLILHVLPEFDRRRGGCRAFIKVYQPMTPTFTSPVL